MNNELYRKLTSITLMTIMFAGGMTIAIPGELPTAVAQTNTLSVSASAAGVFGGPQVIEIVVDDPDRADSDDPTPDVEIDEQTVTMTQAATGKWYAYVADNSSYVNSTLAATTAEGTFLRDLPAIGSNTWPTTPTIVQLYEFDDGDDVEITAGRSESVTLSYDDHSGIATIDVDRNDVPVGGMVHVTISDFMLNLDPTATDTWTLTGTDGSFSYIIDGTAVTDFTINFGNDDTGTFKIVEVDEENLVAVYAEGAVPMEVTIEETRSNTGVFESDDGGVSEISISDEASPGDTLTIEYAADSQQIIVDDFDSTLELIADGTWDSSEPLTIRLTNENLDLNTLDDHDMALTDDDLAVLIMGDPITLDNVRSVTTDKVGDAVDVNPRTFVVTLSATTDSTPINVALTSDQLARLIDSTHSHYVHYIADEALAVGAITTDADLLDEDGEPIDATSAIDVGDNGFQQIAVNPEADGRFTITFDTTTATADVNTANEALQTALAAFVDDPDEEGELADLIETQTETVNAVIADRESSTTLINTTLEAFVTAVAGHTSLNGLTTTPTLGSVTVIEDGVDFNDDAEDTTADTLKRDFKSTGDIVNEMKDIITDNIDPVQVEFALEIFTFGADENHAIYRALLEETGDGTAVFEGTVEYTMLNQLNVDDSGIHTGITTLDDELVIILNDGYTGTGAPTVTYGGDHAREDAPTYTGEVSFDSDTYRVADEVTVTLVDPDLNADADGIDIYTVNATVGDNTELLNLEIGEGCTISDFASLSLRETTDDSGTFEGSFDVPSECNGSTTGEDISVTYYDFRDSSGGTTEWGDSATIGADTGSVSFDRTVYPVPAEGFAVMVYVSVDDSDFDESSTSVESIAVTGDAPVTVKAGSTTIAELGTTDNPLEETVGDSGVFEYTLEIRSDDDSYDLEQGSIITVTYNDPTDASGNENSVSDSATFDLRNAVLQSDKSTYVIGQDALLTLIEPDLNLDSDSQETVHIDLIEWDSDADTVTLGNGAFGAVPSNLRETDANTGIFQVVITIPEDINGTPLERGEEITLTYTDYGPSGADTVGETDRAVELQIETSNFGATIELDQNVYTWTDKVFITAVASDYNFDSNVIDEIGPAGDGEITIRVRGDGLKEYRLAETGPDTGVFTGEITLAGFSYDRIDYTAPGTGGGGPTGGTLTTNNEDGLSISFEYSDSEAPLVASALIRWNVGEVQWLEASYAATGSGIVRIIDPDMNTNPSAVDNIDDIVVYSETFLGGIELTVTETQEASGIFEGTVEFDPESASQGHRLQVTEGDIVTAEYDDYTLPPPDGEGDSLSISATTLIGSIVPPLERAPASNPAIVDAFGNALASVSVDQQVQITADLTSGQDRDQDFAYLVQIQNEDGVTIALSWITGTLGAGATFSPSQSWTPDATGSYTATIFVWESVSNPTALSPQLSITLDVV